MPKRVKYGRFGAKCVIVSYVGTEQLHFYVMFFIFILHNVLLSF